MNFINNILGKILDRIFDKMPDPVLAVQNRTISEKDYYKAGMLGGATCGFLGAITIVLIKLFSPGLPQILGYPIMEKEVLLKTVFPIQLFFLYHQACLPARFQK